METVALLACAWRPHNSYYEPNGFDSPKQDPTVAEPPLHISGDAARYDHREGNDDFSQAGAFFRLFDAGQKARLFSNIADAMQGVPEIIVERQLDLFHRADPAYATGVRRRGSQSRPRSGTPLTKNRAKPPMNADNSIASFIGGPG